jgi:beta-lactamase regulating signal transducer with metallopeptidase domain
MNFYPKHSYSNWLITALRWVLAFIAIILCIVFVGPIAGSIILVRNIRDKLAGRSISNDDTVAVIPLVYASIIVSSVIALIWFVLT